ncbi:MAG: YceI family protein [Helicobacteraceae bacterium]|jgi:polyisoprenoid-binding protein YceI|nr:YceI family protein [Helicobacteraceae bacterium]
MKLIKALIGIGLLAGSLFAADYAFTPTRGKVGFSVNHRLLGVVEGRFDKFEGTIAIEAGAVKSLKGSAEVASISTDNVKRDEHLRNDDFFDEPKFPKISFVSKSASGNTITGDLTMHGITKSVTLTAKRDLESGRTGDIFSLTGQVKRSDFKIGDSMTTNVQISDDVVITLEIRPAV